MNSIIDRVTSFFAARNAEAYFVGGLVRDRFLGRESESDLDVAFNGDALAVGRDLAAELGGSLVPLSVPRGIVRVVVPGDLPAIVTPKPAAPSIFPALTMA